MGSTRVTDRAALDVEVELRQAGHSLMASLAEKEGEIQGVVANFVGEKHLEYWTFQDFRVLWERVAQGWEAYRAQIRETTQLFAQLEEMRATRISKAFGECVQRLVKASFLTPREIWIFMDNEAMLVNQCLLANRWALARLTLQLLEGAICGEARNHGCWQDHFITWRDAHIQTAITSSRAYIMAQPKKLLSENSELESLISQLNFLVEHRVQLIRDLMKMNPPEFSKALVSSWHSSIEEVNAMIDNLHTSLVSKMRVNCDDLNFSCQKEMKRQQV
uniref:coiled-coil domain-containing protein 180-like n=1 Tax=Myxine glutinosa TaxID=7769 RepID=UPI00358E3DE4